MATFRVGQRVRKVRAIENPRARINPRGPIPIGAEVIIVRFTTTRGFDMVVEYDGRELNTLAAKFDPIQPERNQTIAWSECLWQPEHIKETA